MSNEKVVVMGLKTILEEAFRPREEDEVEDALKRYSERIARQPLSEYEVPLDGKAAAALIKTATGFHAEFERQIRGENSPFYRKYLDLRNRVVEQFGMRPLNSYQTLELEMTAIDELLRLVAPVRAHAERSIQNIHNYLDNLDKHFHNDVKTLDKTIDEYAIVHDIYRAKERMLEELEPSDPKWLELRREVREAKRALRSTRNTYRMSQQRGYFYTINERGVESFAEMLNETLGFTERVEDAARGYLETLRTVLPAIANMEAQGRFSSGLKPLLERLSKHVGRLMYVAKSSAERVIGAYDSSVVAHASFGNIGRAAERIYTEMRAVDREFENMMGGALHEYIHGK
ncbi:hypothetical protein D6764_01050 [Candidatus Woesearchaeota archaeon]|nr:MAG: hypothetical protein D6764_01050 [Candidatus Woesearchaeota archaeon]